MKDVSEKFPGFPPEMKKNFWMYPRLLDNWWHELSGSEQKCIDFILRRTWGWEKSLDRISLSQFQKGGGRIGGGTGLSQRQIVTAIKGLESKGYILIKKDRGRTNEYSLVVQKMHQGSEETATGSGALNALATSEDSAYTIDSKAIEKRIEKIYKLYSKIIRSGQRLTREAKENIKERFDEYRPEELVCALKNVRENDYWIGIAKVQTVSWFFASEERIATFLALGPYEWSKSEKDKEQ
jgi:hypothetical protein